MADLSEVYKVTVGDRWRLVVGAGWSRRWVATWRSAGSEVVCPVSDLAAGQLAGREPVRRFAWQTRQRHRPGLQYLVSTGRHHGFESLAEQRFLLALDFVGGLVDVLAQPFELRYCTTGGVRRHVPDFLAVARVGVWLVDVRPGGRIRDDDRMAFAAAGEAALACGWRYLVVPGWRPGVMAALDAVSAQRRPLDDRFGLQAQLLDAVATGGVPFGDLVAATSLPVVARAHALHLIWHRRLGIDLSRPLTDATLVRRAAATVDS
ncbi:TnsA-like heteromeric transposase endonuclease subunit [Micromonospora chersina]|uniref:TnsA-like heteromeric transposase endonuclease subunit n=1 Tax=Micromonospora chersina TaxID=47854 RepID=UPI003710384E